jgi:hypothetical protein
MAYQCTGIQMSAGGSLHEHIAQIQYFDGYSKWTTRAEMVAFVERGGQAYVRDKKGDVAYLCVRVSASGVKYVQTIADGIWSDNLPALPRY